VQEWISGGGGGLSVETVAKDRKCLSQNFHPVVTLEIIQNNVRLHINTRKDDNIYEENGVHCCKFKAIPASETALASCLAYSLSEAAYSS
jgi:hypothetical protein